MISEFVGSVGMENFCWIMVLKDWKFVWVTNKRNPNVRLSYVTFVLHWGYIGVTLRLHRGYVECYIGVTLGLD